MTDTIRADFESFCKASYPKDGYDFATDSAGNYAGGWMMGAFFIWQAAHARYAPREALSQQDAVGAMVDDAVRYGTGIMQGGKHVPRNDFYAQTSTAQEEAVKFVNTRISIAMSLVEDILNDPSYEPCGIDFDYWVGTHDKIKKLAQASQPTAQGVDGMVMVPVEPTDAMIEALFPDSGAHTTKGLYKAMLEAASKGE